MTLIEKPSQPPATIVAAPSALASAETDYDAWTVSFIQTLYLGPLLLEDPTGKPMFARTWEVSDINDPDQNRPLQEQSMFDALLRLQLGPIVERLAEMEAQLEDLYRRAESFCRIGVCQEVDAASNTCKVSHGDLLSPAIRFFNPSAGAQSESRISTVGEQSLLFNHGSGDPATGYRSTITAGGLSE